MISYNNAVLYFSKSNGQLVAAPPLSVLLYLYENSGQVRSSTES
jgi:hypothetical protein